MRERAGLPGGTLTAGRRLIVTARLPDRNGRDGMPAGRPGRSRVSPAAGRRAARDALSGAAIPGQR